MLQYELNLRDYIRIVRKRKLVIVFSILLFSLVSVFQMRSHKPIYKASTTVQVQERNSVAGMLTDVMVYSPGDIMETQSRIIKGYPVMLKVCRRMGYVSETTTQAQGHQKAASLQGRISTERVGRTNIIRILATADNPKDAMLLANTVARVYVQESLLEKNKQSRASRTFIEDQLASVENRLMDSEERLRAYGDQVEHIAVAEDIQKKLLALEFELANLLQKYTEKHPKVLMIRQEIIEMEKKQKGYSGKQLQYVRLQREVDVARNIFTMLSQRLEEVKISEAGKVSGAEIVDPAVLPSSPINKQSKMVIFLGAFLGLIVGFVLSFIIETLDTSMGTIDDVENVVKLPVLGVVPSVAPNNDDSEDFIEKIKRKIFRTKGKKGHRGYVSLIVHRNSTAPTAESFRNIKTNMRISPERKVFLITSAGPQEGKTTTLINLAISCAQDGLKVLLVSSDLRRPTIAESFGMKKRPGVSDVLMGMSTIEEGMRGISDMILGKLDMDFLLRNPGLDRLWILPAGSLPLNPAEVLDSSEFDNLIGWMRQEFDVVLFDSPPVLPVADASILAPKMDGIMLCYEIGRTSRHALVRAKAQLDSVNAPMVGIILNHIQPETEASEVYPYYYRYHYYPRKEDSSAEKQVK